MKKLFLFTLILLVSCQLFSQDIIIKRSGEELKSKVVEVSSEIIKYKLFDNLNGPTFTILKTDVIKITYENKVSEIFSQTDPSELTNIKDPQFLGEAGYKNGQADALKYYKGYKTASTVTLVTSIIFPFAGLVPAIITSVSPPLNRNLNYPDTQRFNYLDYQNGYKAKAKRIKSGKVWINFGIGFVAGFVAGLLLNSL